MFLRFFAPLHRPLQLVTSRDEVYSALMTGQTQFEPVAIDLVGAVAPRAWRRFFFFVRIKVFLWPRTFISAVTSMASNRALLRFTVALAVLAALLCLSESTNWLAKSSEPETPQWRFVELPAEHRAFPDGHDITSKTRMEAIRRQEHGEDEYGPLKITDTLVLYVPLLCFPIG